MAKLTVPIQVNLPDDWKEQILEHIKQDGDWVIVTRCKDCIWYKKAGCAIEITDITDEPSEDDYCSFAERHKDD